MKKEIKTWQDRMTESGRRECEGLAIEMMEAEIAELRRSLAAPVGGAAQSGELPPLPDALYLGGDEAYGDVVRGYVADQMEAYAHAAIAHQLPKEALTDEQIEAIVRKTCRDIYGPKGGGSDGEWTPDDAKFYGAICRTIIAASAPNKQLVAPSADDVEWIVNDMGELGVRIGGRCFFCYKGDSLVYDGKHDDGEPILHRNVGKREFGEVVYPAAWQAAGRCQDRYTLELVYTPGLSFGSADNPKHKWLPLPVEVKS